MPVGAGQEYLGRLPTTYTEQVLDFRWDFTALGANDGFGAIFLRLPSPITGMQILAGFVDDGRVVYFVDTPSISSLRVAGTYAANHTHLARLLVDLPGNVYSFSLDGVPLLTDEPIPAYLNAFAIDRFGFDANEAITSAQGNDYVIDNLRVDVARPVPEPATWALSGLGLVFMLTVLPRRKQSTVQWDAHLA